MLKMANMHELCKKNLHPDSKIRKYLANYVTQNSCSVLQGDV